MKLASHNILLLIVSIVFFIGYMLYVDIMNTTSHREEIHYGNEVFKSYLNATRDFNCYLPKVSDLNYGTNKEKIDLSSTIDNNSICKPEQKETILRAWHGPYYAHYPLFSKFPLISIVQDKENLYFQIESRMPSPDFKDVATKYCIDNKEYLADCSATEEKLQIKLFPLNNW